MGMVFYSQFITPFIIIKLKQKVKNMNNIVNRLLIKKGKILLYKDIRPNKNKNKNENHCSSS